MTEPEIASSQIEAAYTYRLTVRFMHSDRDLSEVPDVLGLLAHKLWRKGDEHFNPKGEWRGQRKKSACIIQFVEDHEKYLPQGIKAAITLLQPHRQYIHQLIDQGVEA
ncbi:hypothetical protein [Asticcacaulis taihuensis]|uniref:hypothetical protein n=1 Tax=Asticcacaulis taihuensis TaxID=260084 RepID=UPI000B8A0451|nr:hypothetical protein [Asticcacaulis taihuensis]